jgi:hypothetical protein
VRYGERQSLEKETPYRLSHGYKTIAKRQRKKPTATFRTQNDRARAKIVKVMSHLHED